MSKIKTTGDLRKNFPNLVKQIEDNVLDQLGVFKEKRTFIEDEAIKLTDEEKKQIKIQTRIMAGI
ncbi:hypothetical protein ES702_03826 [subsurface metagenome]